LVAVDDYTLNPTVIFKLNCAYDWFSILFYSRYWSEWCHCW